MIQGGFDKKMGDPQVTIFTMVGLGNLQANLGKMLKCSYSPYSPYSPWLLKNTKMIEFGLGNLHVNPPATWLYPVDGPDDLTIITFFVF